MTVIGLGVGSLGHSAESKPIGFVDAQAVLENTKEGKRAKETLEEYLKSRQKIMDLDEKEIKRIEEEITKQSSVLSPEAKKSKEDDLKRKFIEFQQRGERLQREIQGKRSEVLKEFYKNLESVIKKIAEKDGYEMIFDGQEGGVLLFAKDGLNLTQQVIEEYDKMFP
jgi:outer membrane protein